MKAVVSISDELYRRAEDSARDLRMTRSRLYSVALEEFLDRRTPSEITSALDEVYSQQVSAVEPAMIAAALKSIPKEAW